LAQAQFQDFIGVSERIPDQRPVLYKTKRNNDIVFAELTLKIDLLPRLNHSDGSQNLLRGRRGFAVGERGKEDR
jgi:hypothetical protein